MKVYDDADGPARSEWHTGPADEAPPQPYQADATDVISAAAFPPDDVPPYHADLPLVARFLQAVPHVQAELWAVDGEGAPVPVVLYPTEYPAAMCLRVPCAGAPTCRHREAAWAERAKGQGTAE